MSSNTILINGAKLRKIIESDIGMSIYDFSETNGYSRNLIAAAIRSKKASPVVQNLLRLYKVNPEEYEYKEAVPETKAPEQLTIEDITPMTSEEFKKIVREAIVETLNSLEWRLDTKTNTVTFIVNEEVSNARDRK